MQNNIIIKKFDLIDYNEAWKIQEKYFSNIVDIKKTNSTLPVHSQKYTDNYLIACQHSHVYTIGRSFTGKINSVLRNKEITKRVPFYNINRGGNITYHGPGQIVLYPILNLEYFFKDVDKYLRALEECVILTLREFDIKAQRVQNLTGVWTQDNDGKLKKICAIGIRTSFWTTMHGIAFNVNTDLQYFEYIIPCGLVDKETISMQKILQKEINIKNVEKVLLQKFYKLFGLSDASISEVALSY